MSEQNSKDWPEVKMLVHLYLRVPNLDPDTVREAAGHLERELDRLEEDNEDLLSYQIHESGPND
jgi:hypothetical protein